MTDSKVYQILKNVVTEQTDTSIIYKSDFTDCVIDKLHGLVGDQFSGGVISGLEKVIMEGAWEEVAEIYLRFSRKTSYLNSIVSVYLICV